MMNSSSAEGFWSVFWKAKNSGNEQYNSLETQSNKNDRLFDFYAFAREK